MIDENIISAIYSYCESVSDDQGDVLYNLYRETYLKTMAPRMASGPVQGRFLSLLSKLISPENIFGDWHFYRICYYLYGRRLGEGVDISLQ